MPAQKLKSQKNRKFGNLSQVKSRRMYQKGLKLLCRYCHAVYNGKAWIPFEKMDPKIIDELKASVCPACHEQMAHLSDGVLHIGGAGVKPHLTEIKGIVMHMAKNAEAKNILDRLERIDEEKGGLTVYTTMNQLAVRMGKAVASAFKGGKLVIKWSRNDKPAEVWWTYDKVKK
jgi:NMD protein affecting ribosome stability and mRNA decay